MSGMDREPDHREALDATWERLRKLSLRVDRQFQITQKLDQGREYAVEHPVVALFTLITLAFCTIPLLCFIGFALTSFIVTFLGFLFVEGFLLTVGTLFLVGVLCFVGFLSLGVGTFITLAWFSARAGHQIIGQIRNRKWSHPVSAQNLNGECVKDSGREKEM